MQQHDVHIDIGRTMTTARSRERKREWKAARERISKDSRSDSVHAPILNLNLPRPLLIVRETRSRGVVCHWVCPHCGAALRERDWICLRRDCGLVVRDQRLLAIARNERRGATTAALQIESTTVVELPATRMKGQRARCPLCSTAVGLKWERCKCGVTISRASER